MGTLIHTNLFQPSMSFPSRVILNLQSYAYFMLEHLYQIARTGGRSLVLLHTWMKHEIRVLFWPPGI